MTKNKASRSGFPARPRTIPREDILVAHWLLGEVVDMTDAEIMDTLDRGAAMLVGIGRVRPLPLSVVANLLTVDVDRLRKALAG